MSNLNLSRKSVLLVAAGATAAAALSAGPAAAASVTVTDPTAVLAGNWPVKVAEGGAGQDYVATVKLSRAMSRDGAVTVAAATGAARSGVDFVILNPRVALPRGTSSATVTVRILGNDRATANRAFSLQLQDGRGVTTRGTRFKVTIADDDSPATAQVASVLGGALRPIQAILAPQPQPEPQVQPTAQTPSGQPASQPSTPPASQGSTPPASQPSTPPASQPSTPPASQPAGQPATQAPATQPATPPAGDGQTTYAASGDPVATQAALPEGPRPADPTSFRIVGGTWDHPIVAGRTTPGALVVISSGYESNICSIQNATDAEVTADANGNFQATAYNPTPGAVYHIGAQARTTGGASSCVELTHST